MGVGYTAWFATQNLLYARKRQQTLSQLDQWRKEIVGEAKDWLDRQAAKPTPQTTDQPVTPAVVEATEQPSTAIAAPEADTKLFAGVIGTVQVLIPLTGLVDVDALKAKIEKDLAKVEGEIKSLSGRLGNPGFVNKAPEEVVKGAQDALTEAETQAEILRSRLEML